jgi:general secretion pathway protein A
MGPHLSAVLISSSQAIFTALADPTRRALFERDVKIGVLSRPQAGVVDFYRGLGDLFAVALRRNNRWGGSKLLREHWQSHIDASLSRPVLIVDEAQEMVPSVLAELRLLSSTR